MVVKSQLNSVFIYVATRCLQGCLFCNTLMFNCWQCLFYIML